MPFFENMGESVGDIIRRQPDRYRHLCQYSESVMRGPSPLSQSERELIAAYVSGLNQCQYCHNTHAYTAEAFGIDLGVFESLIDNIDAAPIDPRLKPLIRYARKLTLEPAKMTERDAQAVFEAGWEEAALEDAVQVTALFNFYNRLVEGHGVKANDSVWKQRGRMLSEVGYDQSITNQDLESRPE